jgi:hypothetical protein
MTIKPELIIGNEQIGIPNDSILTAYNKINTHIHSNVSINSFLGISVSNFDNIELLINDVNILPSNAQILSVEDSTINLNITIPTFSLVTEGVFIAGDKYFYNVRVEPFSSIITCSNNNGFVGSKDYKHLINPTHFYNVFCPNSGLYDLLPPNQYTNSIIKSIYIKTRNSNRLLGCNLIIYNTDYQIEKSFTIPLINGAGLLNFTETNNIVNTSIDNNPVGIECTVTSATNIQVSLTVAI